MKIKSPTLTQSQENEGTVARHLPLVVVLVILLTASITYVLTTRNQMLSEPGLWFYKWTKKHGHRAYGNKSITALLPLLPSRMMGPAQVPQLSIDINFENLQKLYKKRAEAMKIGMLVQAKDDFVPASIRYGKEVKVKLRLKGDWIDHLSGDKWSFRIHVKGKDEIFGLRRFSIQHPKVRGYQGEVLFFESLRRVGVLAPRYFFVNVKINGDDIGIMAVEEHFSKELLETNGRREGVIVKFDESLYWQGLPTFDDRDNPFNSLRNVPIDAFLSTKVKETPSLARNYAVAVGLLRGFQNRQLAPAEVFDTEMMGRYLAVAELWGAWHSVRWHNMRYYLNPINLKLEPIGFDAGVDDPAAYVLSDSSRFDGQEATREVAALLEDQQILSAYKNTLQQLVDQLLSGALEDTLAAVEAPHLATLHKEFYFLQPFSYDKLKARARRLQEGLKQGLGATTASVPAYPSLIHAYLSEDKAGTYLEIVNAIPEIVEVQQARWVRNDAKPIAAFEPLVKGRFPFRLAKSAVFSVPHAQKIYYRGQGEQERVLQVAVKVNGENQLHWVEAMPYHSPLEGHPIPRTTVDEQLAQHPFLVLEGPGNSLRVLPGQWKVQGELVVPPGYDLVVPAGTSLAFAPKGALIAHGAIHLQGQEDAPIHLGGQVLEGVEGRWQGVAVLNGGDSEWTHATIRNTTGIERSDWVLTGGVTFYASDIRMDHCIFVGNRGEDALNIVQAQFRLRDIHIRDTLSDAFDADFSHGLVEGALFENIGTAGGGDALDVSGSTVTVKDARFQNISDKALSVGEGSKMKAEGLLVEQAGTGAASKDASRLEIRDSTIKNVSFSGLVAYIKKPEYGPASIAAHNLSFFGAAPHALVQKGNSVTIDDKSIPTKEVDVAQLYETIMKPGAR